MTLNQNNVNDVLGKDVYGPDGNKIGAVGQVYLDIESGRPEWVTVKTGLFGNKESFVPVRDSSLQDDGLRVQYDKDKVKDAPQIEVDQGRLTPKEEQGLYRHYGLDYSEVRSNPGAGDQGRAGQEPRQTDADMSGHTTPDASRHTDADQSGRGQHDALPADQGGTGDTAGPTTDDAMTRSEERLEVDTQSQEAGRARLRKYVVTEQQDVSVPVTREKATIEREPITDANRDSATAGPDISEEEHEVVLNEERPVVHKETVPVERVRLNKEEVTETAHVTEDVRKEQIDADGVDDSQAPGSGPR